MQTLVLLALIALATAPFVHAQQTSPYAAAVLADQPTAYWRLTDPIGSQTAADSSGNGWTATAREKTHFGAPGALLDEPATSLELKGTGWLSTQLVQRNVSEYSLEIWFHTRSSVAPILQDRGQSQQSNGVSVTMIIGFVGNGESATIHCGADGNGIFIGGATQNLLFDGNWHHAVCAFKGVPGQSVTADQFSIYVDGQSQTPLVYTTDGFATAPFNGQDGTTVGHHPIWYQTFGLNKFIGSLEELAVYDYALSAAQVASHYHASGR